MYSSVVLSEFTDLHFADVRSGLLSWVILTGNQIVSLITCLYLMSQTEVELWRLRQEDHDFKAILVNTIRLFEKPQLWLGQ